MYIFYYYVFVQVVKAYGIDIYINIIYIYIAYHKLIEGLSRLSIIIILPQKKVTSDESSFIFLYIHSMSKT